MSTSCRKLSRIATLGLALGLGTGGGLFADAATGEAKAASAAPAPTAAIEAAAAAGGYAFIVFHGSDAEATQRLVDAAVGAAAAATTSPKPVAIEVAKEAEGRENLLRNCRLTLDALPTLIVRAPNGALTAGFVRTCSADQLAAALVGPGAQSTIKALQDDKLVVVCCHNAKTDGGDGARQGAEGFARDPRVAELAVLVFVDPASPAEKGFLEQLRVDPATTAAQTLLILPPGRIAGTFTGAVDAEQLFAALTSAMAGGCGTAGCNAQH